MKKVSIILLVLSMCALFVYGCDSGSGGSGNVCTDDISVSNTGGAKLYYPCNLSSPTGATTMSSGYTGTLSMVEWLSERVAGAGFVVLAFTPSNRMGMVSVWRDGHKACISKLKDLNNNHTILRGMIDTGNLQTCGHSKGGGGSLYASSELGNQLKTTVGLAPWQESFTDAALAGITSATLIQAGLGDTLATASMTRGEYNALGNIKKAYFVYSDADHAAWANASGNMADTLSRDIIAWMKYYMNGDASAAATLNSNAGKSERIWVDSSSGDSGSGCN